MKRITTTMLCAVLVACGGGGGTGTSTSTPVVVTSTLTGTAATGTPITGKVVAIDKNGRTFPGQSDAMGSFTVDVTGGTAPFMLSIVGSSGGQMVSLNSIATAAGQTVNITPLTDLIVSAASGQPGGASLANLCTSSVPADLAACQSALNSVNSTNLSAAKSQIASALSGLAGSLGLGAFDPFSTAFPANGTGLDALLDAIAVTPATASAPVATIKLVSAPNQNLASLSLDIGNPGGAPVAPVSLTAPQLTAAAAAANALKEIRTCMNELNALYPSTLSTPPSSAALSKYVDPTFRIGGPNAGSTGLDYDRIVTKLTTVPSAGGFAQAGLAFVPRGFSAFDFSPIAGTGSTTDTSVLPVSTPAFNGVDTAWVQMAISVDSSGVNNWKFIKGAAQGAGSTCAGWRVAGFGRISMHMQARVSKHITYPNGATSVTYDRSLPLHINTSDAVAEGIASVDVVSLAGALRTYDSTTPDGVGASAIVQLVTPPEAVAPAVRPTALGILYAQGSKTVNGPEAISSCQDLKAGYSLFGVPAVSGTTVCYDEAALVPGSLFKYVLKDAAGVVLYSYAFQVPTIPLSLAFVTANDAQLFPQNISTTPVNAAGLNAVKGDQTDLSDKLSFGFANSTVYGARAEHCGVGLHQAASGVQTTGPQILVAEQPTRGSQTSCTFVDSQLNSGSMLLTAPATFATGAFSSNYMYIANTVLGNMAEVSLPFN